MNVCDLLEIECLIYIILYHCPIHRYMYIIYIYMYFHIHIHLIESLLIIM